MFLEIKNLTMRFGGLIAVNDVSLNVEKGEIHGLIGPNGSGKTTIFNVVSGYYKPSG
jgi:branched-chain amino acid transport system ATP-binding protein